MNIDASKKIDVIGKVIVIVLIAILVIITCFNLLKSKDNKTAMPGAFFASGKNDSVGAITVSAKKIIPETIQKKVSLNGNVSSESEVNIYPDTAGKITRILKTAGDSVKKGDILAYVDPSRPGSSYAASPIVATVSGTITSLNINPGDTVSTGTVVAVVGALNNLKITVYVSEKYNSYLKKGLKAYVSLVSSPNELYEAEISAISPIVNKTSRTIEVSLKLKSKNNQMKPGMFAAVQLVILEIPDTIVVPTNAIRSFNDNTTVFVITPENIAKRVIVTTGISNDSETQITSGLEIGDVIITAGSVADGANVKISSLSSLDITEDMKE